MAARYTTIVKPANRHRNAAMIAHSAVSASASGATVCVSNPRAAPTVGTIPKNGAYRNFQTAPTATGARTNGRKNTNWKNVLPRFPSATRTARNRPSPICNTTATPVNRIVFSRLRWNTASPRIARA